MTEIQIRPMDSTDWALYKNLRLKSLLDSPDSFAATFDTASSFTDDEWRQRLDNSKGLTSALPLLASYKTNEAGLAWGVVHGNNDKYVNLFQMWVSPEYRGKGIGRALVQEIIDWCESSGKSGIRLGVTTTNNAAAELYRSMGFVEVGDTEPLRENSSLKVQNMLLSQPASGAQSKQPLRGRAGVK